MEREPNTQYVASISYGKDSLAMLEAIKILGYPLDRIITSEVWFDDEIQADLPPMVAFKDTADKIILDRYGIKVEHFCAMNKDGTKKTYKQLFYHIPKRRKASADTESPFEGMVKGFPQTRIGGTIWCKHLKETKIDPIGDSLMASPKMGGGRCHDLKKSGNRVRSMASREKAYRGATQASNLGFWTRSSVFQYAP